MPEAGRDLSELAIATAHRLRLLQVDFADEAESVRRQYLAEEIERALAAVVPDDRPAFLHELLARFPTGPAEAPAPAVPESAPEPTRTEGQECRNPGFLIDRLAELLPSLSDQERQMVLARLQELSLMASSSDLVFPAGMTQEIRKTLQIVGKETIDPARALELIVAVVDFICKLEDLAWKAWHTIAPRSAVKRPKALRSSIAQLLKGDPAVPSGDVIRDLEKLRHLIAALISGMGQAGRQFANRLLARFAPAQISALAGMERGGFLVGHEVKCWRKYVELAGTLDPSAIEGELFDVIADYAETLLKKTAE